MATRGSVTTNTDQRVKVEFARRKNRRASITEQFVVPVAKSRRTEKLAQIQHYEFLLQPENLAAVHEIVDHVHRLMESEALALGHVLGPMDKHRLQLWTTDVIALTTSRFEPSDNRDTDPLLQLLEQFQALQEGHACLAEVAVEARQVVEVWERTGIFDDSRSSDEEEESESGEEGEDGQTTGHRDTRTSQQRALDFERERWRKIESSYAYRRIRERAAAHVIKRNTLKWVRSRDAFCSRVEELEVFGNTTVALVEELTTLSDLQRRTALSSASNTNDIYDLFKGKKPGPSGRKIDFSDLMLYSKHLALFTVDHALRRVGEIESKRRLFQLRCLIKLQTWWRKMHEIVKGRRMLKLLEEMRRKKEQEREAEVLRQNELKAQAASAKAAEASARKANKAAGKNAKSSGAAPGTSGTNSHASNSSRSVSSQKADADASTRSLTSSGTKGNPRSGAQAKDARAVMPTPPSTPKTTSISSGGGASKPKKHSVAGAPKDDKADRSSRTARAREARLRKEFEDEMRRRQQEDEEAAQDTDDVETAWKRFMESAQTPENGIDGEEERASTAGSGTSEATRSRGATPLATDDVDGGDMEEWREWSDDEDHAFSERESRVTTPHSSVSSRLSTPRSNGSVTRPLSNESPRPDLGRRPVPPAKVVVAAKKRPPPRRPTQTPTPPAASTDTSTTSPVEETSSAGGLVLPYATAPSPSRRQMLFGTSQARYSRPALPGTGQLSKFMPFAESSGEPARLLTPPVVPTATQRLHLHELDFHQPQRLDTNAGMDMFLLAHPLVDEFPIAHESDSEKPASAVEGASTASSVRVFSSIRANRLVRVRAALQSKQVEPPSQPKRVENDSELPKQQEHLPPTNDEADSATMATRAEPVVVFNSDVRAALLRPIRGRASVVAAYISNPMLKLDFRKEDLSRKPEETQPSSETIQSPEREVPESPTGASSKAKFGSHADWLRSMGLDNAMAVAVRSTNGSSASSVRPVKKNGSNVQQTLTTSMLTIQETTANKARKKRMKEHALPLLGRRSPRQTKPTAKTPTFAPKDERPPAPLPPVVAHEHAPIASEQHRQSRTRRRTVQAARKSIVSDKNRVPDSASEDSLDSSVDVTSVSAAESSSESDSIGDDDDDDIMSETSEREELDPAVESDEGSDENDSQADIPESGDADRAPSRKVSKRARGSIVSTNQRKRLSLHEPKHTTERKITKMANKRPDASDPARDDATSERSPTAQTAEKKRLSGRFRPHVSSFLKRLVPKEKLISHDLQCSDEEDGDATYLSEQDENESHESDDSDAADTADPERAAAFFKLYSQYMGLLSAAPTLGGPV